MTSREIIEHWRKGARDALEMAQLAYKAGKYEHVLFNCHLTVEKALKAVYMEQHHEDHPHTHDLAYLAGLIKHSLSTKDREELKQLSEFAVDARYNDPLWMDEQATKNNAEHWVNATERLLPLLLHEV